MEKTGCYLDTSVLGPRVPLLMHLICHNESLGGKDRRMEGALQGMDETVEYKLNVADGGKMSKVTGEMLFRVKCFRNIPPIQHG